RFERRSEWRQVVRRRPACERDHLRRDERRFVEEPDGIPHPRLLRSRSEDDAGRRPPAERYQYPAARLRRTPDAVGEEPVPCRHVESDREQLTLGENFLPRHRWG